MICANTRFFSSLVTYRETLQGQPHFQSKAYIVTLEPSSEVIFIFCCMQNLILHDAIQNSFLTTIRKVLSLSLMLSHI
jgi:hypothetical protein